MSGTLPPIPLYLAYAKNEAVTAGKTVAANAQAAASLAYFQKIAPSLTTPQALLGNYRALSVVLSAFGLAGSIGNTAVIRDLLTQNPNDPKSLARTLGNPKYLLLAKTLSTWNPPPFANPANVASIASGYKLNTFEAGAGQQVAGLQQALYFTRTIGGIQSITQLQSDPDLLQVVVTSVGLPYDNFAQLSFAQQTSLLQSKVRIADFRNPTTVQRFAEQYLISQQLNGSGASGPAAGSTAALFSDGADTSGDSILGILDAGSGTPSLLGSGTDSSVLSLFA